MLTHPELCPFTALWEIDWKQGPFLESGVAHLSTIHAD